MSYVIQHFYQPTREIVFNPRLKLLLYCQNISKLFLFFRFNLITFSLNVFPAFLPVGNLILYQSHFLRNVDCFDYFFSIKLTANNTSKLHKNLSQYGLKMLHSFFINSKYRTTLGIFLETLWLYNKHFSSVKIVRFLIIKKFYKNVFLFLLLINSFQWVAYSNTISLYSMFFFVFYYFKANKFYNRKFLKVFNV